MAIDPLDNRAQRLAWGRRALDAGRRHTGCTPCARRHVARPRPSRGQMTALRERSKLSGIGTPIIKSAAEM